MRPQFVSCMRVIDCGTWPLTAGRAATDQHASNLTVIRDTSNIQPRSVGKTRLTTRRSRTARPRPPQATPGHPRLHNPTQASHPTQASYPTRASYPTQASRTPPHPQLPNNVARNSPTAISTFESTPLKFRGFQRTPKLTILELRAKSLSYPQISQTVQTKRHKVAQSIHGPQRRAT